jgi:hypothetical protein
VFPDRLSSIERDTPMIGRKAAEARYRINVVMICFGLSMLLLVVVGLSAAAARNGVLEVIAYALLIPPALLIICRFWLRHKYYQLVSEKLGVQVTPMNDVPASPEGYEQWCSKNGVTPQTRQ